MRSKLRGLDSFRTLAVLFLCIRARAQHGLDQRAAPVDHEIATTRRERLCLLPPEDGALLRIAVHDDPGRAKLDQTLIEALECAAGGARHAPGEDHVEAHVT